MSNFIKRLFEKNNKELNSKEEILINLDLVVSIRKTEKSHYTFYGSHEKKDEIKQYYIIFYYGENNDEPHQWQYELEENRDKEFTNIEKHICCNTLDFDI